MRRHHKLLFANGTWTPTMLDQVSKLVYIPKPSKWYKTCNLLESEGFYKKGGHDISDKDIHTLFKSESFIVGLIEGLFTLDDFDTVYNPVIFYVTLFDSHYGLEMLREKLITLDMLSSIYYDSTFGFIIIDQKLMKNLIEC
jgi:hypothetical protein